MPRRPIPHVPPSLIRGSPRVLPLLLDLLLAPEGAPAAPARCLAVLALHRLHLWVGGGTGTVHVCINQPPVLSTVRLTMVQCATHLLEDGRIL
jgi:hypothetical protein